MKHPNQKPTKGSNSDLLRYAGLGTQLFVALGLAVFAGLKLDEYLKFPVPVLVWVLPLLIIIVLIYKLIKETGKKS